jgi:hypothetical protein
MLISFMKVGRLFYVMSCFHFIMQHFIKCWRHLPYNKAAGLEWNPILALLIAFNATMKINYVVAVPILIIVHCHH